MLQRLSLACEKNVMLSNTHVAESGIAGLELDNGSDELRRRSFRTGLPHDGDFGEAARAAGTHHRRRSNDQVGGMYDEIAHQQNAITFIRPCKTAA